MNIWGTDQEGFFGEYGGSFIPEILAGPILELKEAYTQYAQDPEFLRELNHYFSEYVGRQTPLTFAQHVTQSLGGAKIYLKREDLTHTGAHKINNSLGQILLAKRMGKKRIIAETGAGQHGVATATVAAKFGMECIVYMGEVDCQRQQVNVYKMQLLGAKVVPVTSGSRTLKDAINEAMRDWVTNIKDSYYLIGSALGPHPYPTMVRQFQSIIGEETLKQVLEREKRLPDLMVACVGGGSNAIGFFAPFISHSQVNLVGVEAGGLGNQIQQHAARFLGGRPGVLQGTYTYILQDKYGQIEKTHSISAGLDYAGIGPEHAYLHDLKRVQYTSVTDEQALEAFYKLTREEGIIPALESSHALAYAFEQAQSLGQDKLIVINLSGRGDKDIETVRSLESAGEKGHA